MAKDFKEIFEKLKEYESMKWEEIMKASGGKKTGNNNHFVSIDGIIKEVKDYLNEIRSDDFDELFSLRLNGRKRLYGILNDKVFKIVFYDRNHVIYPCHKK